MTGNKLKVVAVNVNGIRSKMASFESTLSDIDPDVFILQETKLPDEGFLKINGYKVFERVRKDKGGGGIAIGVKPYLKPVWINEGTNIVETLSVGIKVKNTKIRVCTGYGPQESGEEKAKDEFWKYLSDDFKDAKNCNQEYLLEMDSNAWLGRKLLKVDPNNRNKNGCRFEQFLYENEGLSLINALQKCQGQITRKRTKLGKVEESIIDHVVMTHSLEDKLETMTIDEEEVFKIVNYSNNTKTTETDHNVVILKFNIAQRRESRNNIKVMNYKNDKGRKMFKNLSENNEIFKKCFQGNDTLEEQMLRFKNEMSKIITTCFKPIRMRKEKPIRANFSKQMKKRNILKSRLKTAVKIYKNDEHNTEIDSLEKEVKTMEHIIKFGLEEERAKELKEKMEKYVDGNPDNLCMKSMWKEFNNAGQPKKGGKISAKYNHNGVLITEEKEITEAFRKEITERLRRRPIREDLDELDMLDEELFNQKIKNVSFKTTKDFKLSELDDVLGNLKVKKARDHEGFAVVLFKKDSIGTNLKKAILDLSNRIKVEKVVSKNMNEVRVTCIPKPGSLKLLKNHRGIFNVSLLRAIVMRLIYNRNYDQIEEKFSQYSVGARKEKNCLINVFVINAVINDILRDPSKNAINIQCLDISQMFDSMNLRKSMISLINGGLNNEDAIIIYNSNREIVMAVKNNGDVSKFTKVKEVVLQGETLAPLIASVDMDTIAKDWLEKPDNKVYKYRDSVDLGSLGMIDDLMFIAEVGVDTVKANAFINVIGSSKGFQFSGGKCSQMMVKNSQNDSLENVIKIDKWSEDRENNMLKDVYVGKVRVEKVTKQKYMGLFIQSNGGNDASVKHKVEKAFANTKQIKNKLKEMKTGRFFMETVKMLRDALLLGNLLYGAEVMYNCSNEDLKALSKADDIFIKEVLNFDQNTPGCLLLLEMGLEPIEVKIKKKRAMYLKYILDHPGDLIYQVLNEQIKKPIKGDWWKQMKADLTELGIVESLEVIRSLSKKEWKLKLNTKCKDLALSILLKKKSKLKLKGKNNKYEELKMKEYLLPETGFNLEEMKEILKIRTDMVDVPKCFPYRYKGDRMCRYHCKTEEDIIHSIECKSDNIKDKLINKDDIVNIINDKYPISLKKKLKNFTSIIRIRKEMSGQNANSN